MIFVDTGGWVAYTLPTDTQHRRAVAWMRQNREPLVTTDYVMDETLTLLKARSEPSRADRLGLALISERGATLYYLTPDDIRAAWAVFHQYTDKDWSFTDCTSKVVMEKLQVQAAFAFDQHFRQFGTVAVVP
jgi:predicted nucleic acid-binding protein